MDELVLSFESGDVGGVKLVKTYTLKRGSYAIKVKHQILNMGSVAVAPQLYLQLVRDGNKPSGESAFYSTFTGPAVYTELKKYQKVEFSDIEKNKIDIEKPLPMATLPWCSTILLAPGCCPMACSEICSCAKSTPTCMQRA